MFATVEALIAERIAPYEGEGAKLGITDDEGHQWKIFKTDNENLYKVFIGHALEWETPEFLPIATWAQAKNLIKCSYKDHQDAKATWSKHIHGF